MLSAACKSLLIGYFSLAAWLLYAGQCTAQFAVGGIYINPQGVLKEAAQLSADERLKLLKQSAQLTASNSDVTKSSKLRKVSLKRLEAELENLNSKQQIIPAEMRYLAGLTRIQYILFYPDKHDVIIAGPAEDWKQIATGEVIGRQSGRSVLHTDDLVVAIRSAFRQKAVGSFIGCSIEPTQKGVVSHAQFMNRLGGNLQRNQIPYIVNGMRKAMGPQAIKLYGITTNSLFALKMVAADYRLKRIALHHDPSPIREVSSYIDIAEKRFRSPASLAKQHRWWFVSHYDAILHNADHSALELIGEGLKVDTAPTTPGSNSQGANKATPAATQFAKTVSKHFGKLAHKVPAFAELRNLVSLTVTAALIAQKSQTDQQNYLPDYFLKQSGYEINRVPVPKSVDSLANMRLIKGRHWLISISGGVAISPAQLIREEQLQPAKPRTELLKLKDQIKRPTAASQWWWD